jgi:hypothetical protein
MRDQTSTTTALRQRRPFAFEAKGGEPHHGSSPLLRSSQEQEEVVQPIAEIYRLPNRDFRGPDRQPDDVDLLWALKDLALKGPLD